MFAGHVVNRSVGMPGATDDIGNWLEPLGLLSLLVEGFVVWQSLAALVTMRRTRPEKVESAPMRELADASA